ncbi:MAG: PAC2 family protein [Candidatus Thermoplasmatota archaeon]
MNEIEIYEYEKVDLTNAFVVCGFPTVGLVGSIASRFIVYNLKLRLHAAFLSDYFPPVTIVSNSNPLPPVRIYAGEKKCGPDKKCEQLVVIVSEFSPPLQMLRPLANKMIEWCKENNCDILLCMEGFNIENEESHLIGVASTEKTNKLLEKYNVRIMEEGMVSGLSGILLYEGKRRNFDVACLLAGVHSTYPDAKAAGRILEVVNKMLPEIEIDPEPLYREAEEIEKQIKEQMKKAEPKTKEAQIMYR